MRPLETALHGVTLACCVALGAGLWDLSHREPPPPAKPAVSEADLQALSREVADLRREISDLHRESEVSSAHAEVPRAVTPAPGPALPAAPAVMAALDNPEVQSRIQAVVESKLEADRKARDEQRQERGREFVDQRLEEFTEEAGLNDSQKGPFLGLMKESREHLDSVRGKVRAKELTRDQARDDLKRYQADLDLRIQPLLTAEQFKQYQDWVQPFRNFALRGVGGGEDRRPRRDRERPVP